MPALWATLTVLLSATVRAEKLSVERLFRAPELSGERMRQPRFSPDGRMVAYLKSADDDQDRLDLWAYDLRTRTHRQLVDARSLLPAGGESLSAEEASRRERQRSSALSGILDYRFAADSHRLLVPLGGDLYLYDLSLPADKALRQLTHTDAYETDARFSPKGGYVSFIRDQNLWVLNLADGKETPVTRQGGGTVSYGTAEFIAQEEMDRFTGYWWAPDDSRIAYTRVDEAPVAQTQRFEINATDVNVVSQRYPYTGSQNALVSLLVAPVAAPQAAVQVDLGSESDVYLARVEFLPDSQRLAVERQSRDQKRLDLLLADAATGHTQQLLSERSAHWVPLTDDLKFLKASPRFIWASDRDGYRHLYLYDLKGRLLRALTQGENMTVGDTPESGLRGVDEQHGYVYFMSNAASDIERQLYRVALNRAGPPRQITQGAGWHSVRMDEKASVYLDTSSSATSPPSLTLRDARGKALQVLIANRLQAGHPYFPYLDHHAVPQFGSLIASDGQRLNYELFKPPGMQPGRRYPVIVYVYGGPHVQSVSNSWGGSWQMFQELLASEGFIVFVLDNRGSGARGERFEAASWHHLGDVEVADQVAGVKYLRSLPFVDPQHIGIFGWSYGGYLALQSILRAPESFAAAVAGAPVTDWKLYDTHYTERYLGTPQENPEGYRAASVLTYAKGLSRPLLLLHGMADDNVLFQNSTLLMKALQEADRPFELMTYPGGKHGLIGHADQGPHALNAILNFFKRELASP
jgi:dipeptidyl-peptidase-4